MKTKRKLYIIPGAGESTRFKGYRAIAKAAKACGFQVVPVNIHWSSRMDMTDFVAQAESKIKKLPEERYILGFSLGAYIAAVLSQKVDANGFFFCSISPYFKENLKDTPAETRKYWGQKIMRSFGRYSFPGNVSARAWFLMGDKDWEIAQKAIIGFYKKWKGKKSLIWINNAGHELSHPTYEKQISDLIKML